MQSADHLPPSDASHNFRNASSMYWKEEGMKFEFENQNFGKENAMSFRPPISKTSRKRQSLGRNPFGELPVQPTKRGSDISVIVPEDLDLEPTTTTSLSLRSCRGGPSRCFDFESTQHQKPRRQSISSVASSSTSVGTPDNRTPKLHAKKRSSETLARVDRVSTTRNGSRRNSIGATLRGL
eukprot:Platyproteum_vivax@DN5_c0_g1_i1.p1